MNKFTKEQLEESALKVTPEEMALGNPVETPAPGFRTTEEWAKVWRVDVSKARHICSIRVAEGKMQRRVYLRPSKQFLSFPVKHYALAKCLKSRRKPATLQP